MSVKAKKKGMGVLKAAKNVIFFYGRLPKLSQRKIHFPEIGGKKIHFV